MDTRSRTQPFRLASVGPLLARASEVCALIAEVTAFFIMFLVTAEVIGRRFFGSPIPGQMEAATLCLVVVVYFGLPYTQAKGGHIRVTSFIDRVGGVKRELLELLSLGISAAVSTLALWRTAAAAKASLQGREFISGVVNFPVWPSKCAVAFGFALLTLVLAAQILERVGKLAGAGSSVNEV